MAVFDISIIIPVYNTKDLVEKCVIPILELADDTIEVICVNDGSRDNSLEVLKNIQLNYPKMVIVDKENGGLSSARNSGLEVANGEYILFLDSDDWLDLEKFLELKAYCKDKYDIIHGNFNYTYDDRDPIKNKIQYEGTLSGQEFLSRALLTNQFSIPACINFYKRSFFIEKNLKFMEGIYHEDEEFNIKAFSLAKSVTSKNIHFYQYYQRSGSITNNPKNGEKRFLDVLKIYRSIVEFSHLSDFGKEFKKIIMTYMSLVVISGYIKINDTKIQQKYFNKIKSMRLHHLIQPYTIQFKIVRIMLRYCPRLFFILYGYYFRLTSKKL